LIYNDLEKYGKPIEIESNNKKVESSEGEKVKQILNVSAIRLLSHVSSKKMIVALIKVLIKVCNGLTNKLKYNINELNFEDNYV